MSAGVDINETVTRVLVEALNADEADIKPAATLQGDLGAESIDFLDIICCTSCEREVNNEPIS